MAGCCATSHGLCRAHTHTGIHTHRHKCHLQTWTCLCLQQKRGLRPRVVVRHLVLASPSPGTLAAPLKKPWLSTPTSWFNRKQMSTTWLKSRAVPGALQALQGRALAWQSSLAHSHFAAELVPVPQQGLDLGGAHPQPLLQQHLLGCILPVLVPDVDGQGTLLGPQSTCLHRVCRVLTPLKTNPM